MKNEVLLAIVAKAMKDEVLGLPSPRPGPRGFNGGRGDDGRDGKDFNFEEAQERIAAIIRAAVLEIRDELKLKFTDLSVDDIESLRGPSGRDGRNGNDGRDFVYSEHAERIDLAVREAVGAIKAELKLQFSDLTEEEKSELKLRFTDLNENEIAALRGARGARGQQGRPGRDGKDGSDGQSIRGLPGPSGGLGRQGKDGMEGQKGEDAPRVVSIEALRDGDDIEFLFAFDDGQVIPTNRVRLK